MPGTGEPQAALGPVRVCPVARDGLVRALSLDLGLRIGGDGLICVCPSGGESVSVTYRGGGDGETYGHGDSHHGDDQSLVQMVTAVYVRSDLGMAL